VGRSLCVSGALCVGALCVGRSLVGPSPPVSDPFHVDIRSRDGSRSGARSHGYMNRLWVLIPPVFDVCRLMTNAEHLDDAVTAALEEFEKCEVKLNLLNNTAQIAY